MSTPSPVETTRTHTRDSVVNPERARAFRRLHRPDACLVLPNAWDAASAAMVESAGAQAVGTTSAGVAWALGRADGQHLTATEATDAIRRITRVVTVPVTADIEGGYGATPGEVAETIRAVVAAGAVGVNLEDSPGTNSPLRSPEEQAGRIQAVRSAASTAGLPDLFVNARTDVCLAGVGSAEERLDLVLARADAYAEAGADLLFVPGLLDLASLQTLVENAPLAINAMAVPGGPTVTELRAVGVRRISVGMGLAQAAYALARDAAKELLAEGTYQRLRDGVDYGELNRLLA